MSVKKTLFAVIAIAIILYLLFAVKIFNFVSFDEGLKEINSIDNEFDLGEKLVPAEENQLKEYQAELTGLEKEFSEKNQNDDIKALNYLITAKKELAQMQLDLIELQKTQECNAQIELIDSIIKSATTAGSAVQDYVSYYPDLAEKTNTWNENALDTTDVAVNSFNKLKQEAERTC